MSTVFTKIINGEIPSAKIYEDEFCLAIMDINPVVKGHALVIAKKEAALVEDHDPETLGRMLSVAGRISARQKQTLGAEGSNIMINNGEAAGQTIPHLHIHVIPRYASDALHMPLPKLGYSEGELEKYQKKLILG